MPVKDMRARSDALDKQKQAPDAQIYMDCWSWQEAVKDGKHVFEGFCQ